MADRSITTWEIMEDTSLRKWGEKKDHGHCLTDFNTLKKRHNEGVSEFIKRFNKLYLSLPVDMKPHQTAAKVVLVAVFDSEFDFSLRERKPATLDDAQTDALELEANFASTSKSKGKSEQDTRRKGKEKVSTSSQDRDSDNDKIEGWVLKMLYRD